MCIIYWLGLAVSGFSQSTAFLYQGQLTANGAPANGSYDMEFTLITSGQPTGNALTNLATPVSNGLFSVALDFGPGVFNGAAYWMQIGVRGNSDGGFVQLTPAQPVMAAPYAVRSAIAASLDGPLPSAQLSGAYPVQVTFANAADSFAGSFQGDGGGLTNVDAAALNGVAGSHYATMDLLTNYAQANILTNYATASSLTNYATLAELTSGSGSSATPGMQVFDMSGTAQFVVPAGVTTVTVEIWGGGGGGGNAGGGSGSAAMAAGGGAGGYGKGIYTVKPGDTYEIGVGAGGTAAAAGGASSFGALINAGGGAGGPIGASSHGGIGGGGSGIVNITGGSGLWAFAEGGNCGGSAGNGGSGGVGDSGAPGYAGSPGQAPGGGGGGGFDLSDPGGAGAHGRVIVSY